MQVIKMEKDKKGLIFHYIVVNFLKLININKNKLKIYTYERFGEVKEYFREILALNYRDYLSKNNNLSIN
jgi:hypothetical protein